MMLATDRVPVALLQAVVAYYEPQRVILFGSRARGEAGADSDIDLLIVVDDDLRPEKLGWRGIHEARKDYHDAVDLVPWPRAAFEQRRTVVGSLPWTAEQEGVLVYERP